MPPGQLTGSKLGSGLPRSAASVALTIPRIDRLVMGCSRAARPFLPHNVADGIHNALMVSLPESPQDRTLTLDHHPARDTACGTTQDRLDVLFAHLCSLHPHAVATPHFGRGPIDHHPRRNVLITRAKPAKKPRANGSDDTSPATQVGTVAHHHMSTQHHVVGNDAQRSNVTVVPHMTSRHDEFDFQGGQSTALHGAPVHTAVLSEAVVIPALKADLLTFPLEVLGSPPTTRKGGPCIGVPAWCLAPRPRGPEETI